MIQKILDSHSLVRMYLFPLMLVNVQEHYKLSLKFLTIVKLDTITFCDVNGDPIDIFMLPIGSNEITIKELIFMEMWVLVYSLLT